MARAQNTETPAGRAAAPEPPSLGSAGLPTRGPVWRPEGGVRPSAVLAPRAPPGTGGRFSAACPFLRHGHGLLSCNPRPGQLARSLAQTASRRLRDSRCRASRTPKGSPPAAASPRRCPAPPTRRLSLRLRLFWTLRLSGVARRVAVRLRPGSFAARDVFGVRPRRPGVRTSPLRSRGYVAFRRSVQQLAAVFDVSRVASLCHSLGRGGHTESDA